MEDIQIVELYWERSETAIYETQRKYGRYCYCIASNILPLREDAQECVNDTYLAAWNAMPPNRPSILSTFLGKLTRRISIDRWRKLTADKRGGSTVDIALEELEACIPGGRDPLAEIEDRELVESVNLFLETLPYIQRKVFLMRYFHLSPLREIETAFQMSGSKVKSMLHRTRKQLRVHLQKEGY